MIRYEKMQSAFTMIETLIVLTIIVVISQLLLSSTAEIRERARYHVCISNIRQLLIASKMYEQDNDEQLPVHFNTHEGGWQIKVHHYLKNSSVFFCMSDSTNGLMYARGGLPTSYEYMLTRAWLRPNGDYRPPDTLSPIILDPNHFTTKKKFLIGRYDGSVESAGAARYETINYLPLDQQGPN